MDRWCHAKLRQTTEGQQAHAHSKPEPIWYFHRITDLWSGLVQVSWFQPQKSLDQTNHPGSVFILWNMMHMSPRLRVKQLHGTLTNMPQKIHTRVRQSKWQANGWKMNGWIRVLVVILGDVQWGWRGVNGVCACHAPYSELETTVRAPAIEIKGCHFSCVIKSSVLTSPSLELW